MCVCARSFQWCPTLCDPVDCSPQGFLVHGILQARHWRGLPCPPPGDLPNPGIKPESPMSPALAGRFFTTSATWEVPIHMYTMEKNRLPFAKTWMHVEGIMLSELNQTEKDKYCMISLICGDLNKI